MILAYVDYKLLPDLTFKLNFDKMCNHHFYTSI